MSCNSSEKIKITHVINPHLFFYKKLNQIDSDVVGLERELKKYVDKNRDEMCAINGGYSIGDYVAVYVVSQKKWIRAQIDESIDDEIVVWATDYGFPLKTPRNLVIILRDELKYRCETMKPKVFKGGISDILPATARFDISNVVRMIVTESWEQKCIEHLERLKDSPVQTTFTVQFVEENHMFGVLEIRSGEKVRCVSDIFAKDLKCASKVPLERAQQKIIEASRATWKIDRWLNNFNQINCVENQIVVNVLESIESSSQSSQATGSNSSQSNVINQIEIIRKYVPKIPISTKEVVPIRKDENKKENRSTVRNASVPNNAKANALPNQVKHSPQLPSGTNPHSTPIINTLKQIRILAHNNTEEPIKLNCACFTESVSKGMKKLGLTETYVSQGYAWPNLLRGNSLVVVDSQNRGKTVAYLPALCSRVERTLQRPEKSTLGTIAIIVCLTANVQKIASLCESLLQMPLFKCHVVKAIGKRDTYSTVLNLLNGCNILVTTAPCLKELLAKNANAIKTIRLECIAFENIDCIMEKHRETCNFIIEELCSRRSNKGHNRQIIVTSRTWQPFLDLFLKENKIGNYLESVLLIGNYLEAAFYGRVAIQFIPANNKTKALEDEVRKIPIHHQKTMIICNTFEEAESVVKLLREKDIPTDLVKNIETEYSKSKVNAFWTKMDGVLVCADEHLKDTGITDAQNIIHYSVPDREYRTFLFRFSAMLEYYCDVVEKPKATSTILIDHSNGKHLPKFVDLLKRFNQEITEELEKASQIARSINMNERAHNLRFAPICNYVLMHGTTDHPNCRKRHKLLKWDEEDPGKIECGVVRFHVLKIISPSEYIVRPTSLQTDGNTWKTILGSDQFIILDAQIQQFYRNDKNIKSRIVLSLGEKCVIERHDRFYRAEIIEIFPKSGPIAEERCNVRLLDTGDIQECKAHDIYSLDEAFQELPNQAYYLHLTGIIPADHEDDWDPRAVELFRKELQEYTEKEGIDVIYEGNIILSLRNTLVVDIMRLVNIKRGVVYCSVKRYLNNKSFGIFSPESRKKVLALAHKEEKPKTVVKTVNSCNTSTPKSNNSKSEQQIEFESFSAYENEVSKLNEKETSQASWEEEEKEKWACPWKNQHKNVIISQFYSPNDFYIYQNSKQLEDMYRTIDEYVKENIDPALDQSMKDTDIYKYCLVKVDGAFNRGKIFEEDFNETNHTLKVFLVDIGTKVDVEVSDVYDIPNRLIEMMPFQAIWCNLVGVKPIQEHWTEEQSDLIYDAIDEYGFDLYLHTIRADKSICSDVTDTNIVRHDVVLVALRDNQEIIINKMILSMKLADIDPKTINDLENVPPIVDDDDEDWDDEVYENTKQPQNVVAEAAQELKDEGIFAEFGEIPMDEIVDFLKDALMNNEPQSQTQPKSQSQPQQLQRIDEGEEVPTPVNGHDTGYVSSSSSDEIVENKHQIEYFFKRPKVDWWQTEEKIVLRIKAHESVKYGLEIKSDYLVYSTQDFDEPIMAVLNLFGSIDLERITHYVRGLNVIVHLYKSCNILWPRLLCTGEKCCWIIENFDAMPNEGFASYNHQADDEQYFANLDSDDDENDVGEGAFNNLFAPSDEGDDDFNDIENESI